VNQILVIGFLGKDPQTASTNNGTPVLKFSVATNKYWTDANDERHERAQWHQIVAFGPGFSKLAERLKSGSQVFVQGELQTREYERTIQVPSGKKFIEHKIKQLVVEIKADTIRVLDRSAKAESGHAETQPENTEDIPY
jgi:single-strand DNA-binding protein